MLRFTTCGDLLHVAKSNMASKPTGRPRGRPLGSVHTDQLDLALFDRLHRRQAKLHRRRQRLHELMVELEPDDPLYVKYAEKLKRIDSMGLEKTDAFLAKSSAAIVNIKEATADALGRVPTEQMEAQLDAEFVASVSRWTSEQWAIVDEFRKQRAA